VETIHSHSTSRRKKVRGGYNAFERTRLLGRGTSEKGREVGPGELANLLKKIHPPRIHDLFKRNRRKEENQQQGGEENRRRRKGYKNQVARKCTGIGLLASKVRERGKGPLEREKCK